VVITVLGLVIAVVRGQGLFDIDFTGGVSVQTAFQQGQKIEDIRDRIDGKEIPENLRGQITAEEIRKELPDATVTVTHSEDEPENQRFIVDTSNPDREQVEDLLKQLFGDKLVTLTLSSTVGTPLAPEKPATTTEEKKPATTKEEKKPETTKKPETAKEETKPAKTAAPPVTNPPEKKPTKPEDKRSEPPLEKSAPKPADPKSADAKSKQSRSDLPPPSLVAMTGDDAVLLALAESPAVKATADPKSETKPQPKAAAQPKTEAKAENQPPPKVSTVNTPLPAAKVDSPAADSGPRQTFEATLTLSSRVTKLKDNESQQKDEPVRYDEDRLKNVIEQVLEANRIPVEQVKIDLTALDGSKKSDRWVLKLAPSMEGKNPLTPAKFQTVLSALEAKVRTLPYFPIEDKIGSAVANDTKFWAVVALVSSWSLIILYLWIRFQGVAFGLAAVIALIHDVLVMLGAIAFSSYLALIPGLSVITLIQPFKINLPIVAAFLTIIGYSVNDTIVVFDRIREIRGKSPTLTRQMVNDATNQTLSRTVLTSFTVMLVVFILYIFGGQAVHGFAFALIIGVLTGTYSSIYVAAPILLWLLHPKEMSATSASDKPPQGR
jgi:SecD/SecF fusion protein